MTSRTFNISKSRGTPKSAKIADTIDVAARYFVYNLYEATDGQPKAWATLRGMGELRATIARAVERGWVILEGASGKPLERKGRADGRGPPVSAVGGDRTRPPIAPTVDLTIGCFAQLSTNRRNGRHLS